MRDVVICRGIASQVCFCISCEYLPIASGTLLLITNQVPPHSSKEPFKVTIKGGWMQAAKLRRQ